MYQKKGEPNVWLPDEEDDEQDNVPIRTSILRKGVGVIEMQFEDDQMVWFCGKCKAAGFEVKMGPKILMPGEKRQSDYENWVQCPDCFDIQPTYVMEGDANIIKDDIPTVETPFENTTKIMGANPKRTTKAGQRALAKRRRDRTKLDDDPEIDSLLKIYGDRVKVLK